jgi:hypothetical protein
MVQCYNVTRWAHAKGGRKTNNEKRRTLQRIYGSVPNAFHASFVFLPPVQKKTKRPDPQPLLHSSSGGKPRGGHMGSNGTNGAVDRWTKWGGGGSPGTAPLLSAPTWCLAGQWSHSQAPRRAACAGTGRLGPVSPPTHVAALPSPHPVSSVVALAPRRRREGSHACCCPECPLCASPHYSELPRLAGRLCRKGGSMRPRPAEHEHMVKDVVIGHGHALYARHACPTGTTGEGRREDPTHLAVLDRPAVSGKINGSRQAWWCWRSLHAPLFLLRLPWLLLAASEPASLP